MPIYKLELSTDFTGCDDTLYIHADAPPSDEELESNAQDWAGVSFWLEECDLSEEDLEDGGYDIEDWG